MKEIYCPICKKNYSSVPFKCECGYEEDSFVARDLKDERERLFAIYKFSKLVFNKKVDWKQSEYDSDEHYDKKTIVIKEIFEDKALAYVDFKVDGKIVRAKNGILAFNENVESLIINVDEIEHEFLDESHVRMLFLGGRVKYITDFINLSLKYIEVDKNNPYFTAKNNVLFTKDMKELVFYCNEKKEEEYYIPKEVKKVRSRAFINVGAKTNNLKVIHCSKKVIFEDPGCNPPLYEQLKIVYDIE